MQDRALYFELISIGFLLASGVSLIAAGFPGQGLICSAVLLAGCSLVLRKLKQKQQLQPAVVRTNESDVTAAQADNG